MNHLTETNETNETAKRILDAVQQLIIEGGLPAVTLSAVCRYAEISKGGLVHHYPTKESMVDAFIERSCNEYLKFLEDAMFQQPPGGGRRAKALVDLLVSSSNSCPSGEDNGCVAVMLAFIQSGGTVPVAHSLYSKLINHLRDDGLSRDAAETLIAATDGMWYQSMIEPEDLFAPKAKRVRRQLKKFIELQTTAAPLSRRETLNT